MTADGKLELVDINVGEVYVGGKYISPGYLSNAKLTVVKKGRKNVMVKHPAYHETFAVSPDHLAKVN